MTMTLLKLKKFFIAGSILIGLVLAGTACSYDDDDDDGYATPTSPAIVEADYSEAANKAVYTPKV